MRQVKTRDKEPLYVIRYGGLTENGEKESSNLKGAIQIVEELLREGHPEKLITVYKKLEMKASVDVKVEIKDKS